VHEGFCNVFERLLLGFSKEAGPYGVDGAYDLNRVAVLGLELEGLWDEIAVDASNGVFVRGLYVVGDCAGIAQGILQAMVAGIQAGHALSLAVAGS